MCNWYEIVAAIKMKTFLRYMGNMYTLDAFNTSNPADQDILSHYKMQQVIVMKWRQNINMIIDHQSSRHVGQKLKFNYFLVWVKLMLNGWSGHKDVEERGTGNPNLHQLCPGLQLELWLELTLDFPDLWFTLQKSQIQVVPTFCQGLQVPWLPL